MDSDTWNAYHIISNRARSICYSMRQTEFRMQAEKTVNHLANAALENVNMLKNLAVRISVVFNKGQVKLNKILS